jgi:choline dehydrogenase-like flavoprotein
MYDVIVIGSGAGGAPIAYTLAKANKSVLVLEKGPLFRTQDDAKSTLSAFKRDELISDGPEQIIRVVGADNYGSPFYASHVEPDLNDEPHIYKDLAGKDLVTIEGYTAQVVGGGTNLYGAVSLRFTPTDLKLRSFNEGRTLPTDPNGDIKREARDWPISYEQLQPYYEKTERLIGLNGWADNQLKPFNGKNFYQKPLEPNPISQFALQGMIEFGKEVNPQNPAKPYRTPLAVITQDHGPSGRKVPADNPDSIKTSYVNRYGDPLGHKSNTWVSLLSLVEDLKNFEIEPNCTVTHLGSENGNVNKVHYRDPTGKPRIAEGKIVVVACSAIESVRLLQISAGQSSDFNKRIYQNPLLGKYFLTHAFGGASGFIPDDSRADKSVALDSDWATDACNNDQFLIDNNLWAGATVYNNTSDAALPLSLFRTMDAMDLDTLWKGLENNLQIRGQGFLDYLDRNFGRTISLTFMANQVPQGDNRIELHPTIKDKWNRPVAYVNKGWHPHDKYLMDTMAEKCRRIFELGNVKVLGAGGSYQAPNGMIRIANHILGGARFGDSKDDSVLNPSCRAWEFDNLYVTDGCFMPTSGSGNPTHTIEANSFRVAEEILKAL